MRRLLLLAALLSLAVPATAHARPFKVGTGQHAGIAIDDGGTIYVAWQINVYNPGDAVQFCIIPPRATRCGYQTTVAFPGQSFNRARASVILQGNNVIDVVEPRTDGTGAYSFLARSVDGGKTFGPPVKLSAAEFEEAIGGPNGSVAMVGGPTTLRAGLFGPDGSSQRASGSELGPFLEGVFHDIAFNGSEVLAAGSDAGVTHAFRLPAGADPNTAAAWQQIDPARARQPRLAGLPGSFAVLLEPSDNAPNLFVQRLEGAAWSPPVAVAPSVPNSDFQLVSNSRGRLTAVIIQGAYHYHYTTSTDGGVLWSSLVNTANFKRYQSSMEIATNSSGAGAAVGDAGLDDKAIRVSRFSPRAARTKRRTIRGRRVQLRSWCDDGKLSVLVEAARGNRRVSPATVLTRARFGRTRRARPGFRNRFRARYSLRRRHATVPVRLVTRRGKDRTVRLRVRRCGATS